MASDPCWPWLAGLVKIPMPGKFVAWTGLALRVYRHGFMNIATGP